MIRVSTARFEGAREKRNSPDWQQYGVNSRTFSHVQIRIMHKKPRHARNINVEKVDEQSKPVAHNPQTRKKSRPRRSIGDNVQSRIRPNKMNDGTPTHPLEFGRVHRSSLCSPFARFCPSTGTNIPGEGSNCEVRTTVDARSLSSPPILYPS